MTFFIALFLAGLLVGSVINWLADQLPLFGTEDEAAEAGDGEQKPEARHLHLDSLRKPVCVRCGMPRPALAYVGLLAWISGKRQCASCGHKMSIRYPIVEILLGLTFSYLYGQFGLTGQLVVFMVYLTLFVLIAVIDIEYRYILNVIMLPAFIFALIELAIGGRMRLRDGLIGYAVGQLVVMAIYLFGIVYLWSLNRGRENKITEIAFGFGDVTLATFCGLIVGYPNIVYMLVLMIIIGGVIAFIYGAYYIIVARRYGGYVPIAYGPAILLSATVMLLWPAVITSAIYGPH